MGGSLLPTVASKLAPTRNLLPQQICPHNSLASTTGHLPQAQFRLVGTISRGFAKRASRNGANAARMGGAMVTGLGLKSSTLLYMLGGV